MFDNVSQTMADKDMDNCFLSEEDIDEEIEIIGSEEIEENELSGDEDNDELGVSDGQSVDHSVLVFEEHKGAVLCCGLSGDNTLCVSGSQDDMGYVWRTESGQTLFQCKGHKDSLICAQFNRSDSYIATADMSGLIIVWKMNGEKVFDYEIDDINWMSWHPMVNNVLMAGTGSGDAWMWKMDSQNSCKTFQSFGSSNSTAKCLNDGKRIAMGYEDGVIRIWDLKSTAILHTISDFNGHNGSVTSLDCTTDNALLGSGSVDCTAKLINTNNGKVVATFQCGSNSSNEEENNDSVESVSLSSIQSLFATGTVDGSVEIWDISTQVRRHICQQSSGVSKLLWDKNNPNILYTAGLDGIFRIYDGRSGQLLDSKEGHNDHILDFALSSDSRFVLTASEDNSCRIFSLS